MQYISAVSCSLSCHIKLFLKQPVETLHWPDNKAGAGLWMVLRGCSVSLGGKQCANTDTSEIKGQFVNLLYRVSYLNPSMNHHPIPGLQNIFHFGSHHHGTSLFLKSIIWLHWWFVERKTPQLVQVVKLVWFISALFPKNMNTSENSPVTLSSNLLHMDMH